MAKTKAQASEDRVVRLLKKLNITREEWDQYERFEKARELADVMPLSRTVECYGIIFIAPCDEQLRSKIFDEDLGHFSRAMKICLTAQEARDSNGCREQEISCNENEGVLMVDTDITIPWAEYHEKLVELRAEGYRIAGTLTVQCDGGPDDVRTEPNFPIRAFAYFFEQDGEDRIVEMEHKDDDIEDYY